MTSLTAKAKAMVELIERDLAACGPRMLRPGMFGGLTNAGERVVAARLAEAIRGTDTLPPGGDHHG